MAGVNLTNYDWVLGIRDVGLTGHADVVIREKATGRLWLLPGTTTGVGARQLLGAGAQIYDLAG